MENEIWQVQVKGEIYECKFAELEEWIADRTLLPEDKVRRGERGWIQAGHVPALQKIFAGEKSSVRPETKVNTASTILPPSTSQTPETHLTESSTNFRAGNPPPAIGIQKPQTNFNPCHFHADEPAAYVCRSCGGRFCKSCPKSYGTVRICPICGEMCKLITDFQTGLSKAAQYKQALRDGYGFNEFRRAWAFPFKFWQSLGLGALLVALLSFGGMIGSLLANAVLFGCIAQTISHLAHGEFEQNFMPDFDNFDVWNDVAKPFFLSVGVSIVSFLPAILLMFVLFFSVFQTLSNPSATIKEEQEKTAAAIGASPSSQILLDQKNAGNSQLPAGLGNSSDASQTGLSTPNTGAQTLDPRALPPELNKNDSQILFSRLQPIFNASPPLAILLLLSGLWAIFYLPMALTIAGYTRSFISTINPLVGIDTMRRMGKIYFTAFAFWLIVQIISLILAKLVNYATAPFDMPFVGNLPATFIINLLSFYFSLVTAFILGSALYKSSDRLDIEIN